MSRFEHRTASEQVMDRLGICKMPPYHPNRDRIGQVPLTFQWNYPQWAKIAQEFLQKYEPDREIDGYFANGQLHTGDPSEAGAEKQPEWPLGEHENPLWENASDSCSEPRSQNEPECPAEPEQDEMSGEERERLRDYQNSDRPPDTNDDVWRDPVETVELRIDPLAWYVPLCMEPGTPGHEYGIHFDGPKMVGFANRLSKADPHISMEKWMVAALVDVYWHEVCHAWVEDLVSLVEDKANPPSGKNALLYDVAARKWKPYIFMEEALCNSVACGMSRFFWQMDKERSIIDKALRNFMNNQPRGYRNYVALPGWATRSQIFIENIKKLLTDIYLIAPADADKSIGRFFDYGLFRHFDHALIRILHHDPDHYDYIMRRSSGIIRYPVFVHGKCL